MAYKTDNYSTSDEYTAKCDRYHDQGVSDALAGLPSNQRNVLGSTYRALYCQGYHQGKAERARLSAGSIRVASAQRQDYAFS